MDKFPEDDETREKPRKPTRKRPPKSPDDLKLVSVFKPGTNTTKFAERIYVDVFNGV